MRTGVLAAGAVALCVATGCSSTASVSLSPGAAMPASKALHVVVPAGASADVSAAVQRAFVKRGYAISAGPQTGAGPGESGVVRFADSWRWDVAMYLFSLDIQLFDARGETLLASGRWRNAHFHGFQDPADVADKVVGEMMTHLGAPAH